LTRENWKLKDLVKQKDSIINFYQSSAKTPSIQSISPRMHFEPRIDASATNNELCYFINDLMLKIPERIPPQEMYSYLTDSMRFILKAETSILLRKDFEIDK